MKNIQILIVTLFLTASAIGQKKDVWKSFFNKDSSLIGFKDKNNMVKIKPKFTGLTTAKKFENIIAVSEEVKGGYFNYYLSKNGKKSQIDNLFFYDNSPDCESEGYIRFRDKKTDKVGLLDKNGNVVIAALYDALTNVRNGQIISLKGAIKQPDTHNDGCNHYTLLGGIQELINIKGIVLISDFKFDNNLNLFSIKEEKIDVVRNETREYFEGKNKNLYSFINYEKEFKHWINNSVLNTLTKDNLIKVSFNEINYWVENEGWKTKRSTAFINDNFEKIKDKLQNIKKPDADFFISSNELNIFMFESPDFDKYYNNCNESKYWQYPVMTIIINNKDVKQNSLDFLRTDNGYKLISVSL